MVISGKSPDGKFVEIAELPGHPWYVAVQFHPEFKSKPLKPHPLFASFVEASYRSKPAASRGAGGAGRRRMRERRERPALGSEALEPIRYDRGVPACRIGPVPLGGGAPLVLIAGPVCHRERDRTPSTSRAS